MESTSSGYQVLARRYRSRDFEEVVGQEAIARTLNNAIDRNQTAHAYLFCGSRGVGKTSMARIFARKLNATADQSEHAQIADTILRGEDIDVIEIDGASNRGIEDARDLIANAGLMPSRSPFKIYIIDEVHMLTTPAFNALLKTMEEPPSHVKFILCTTDAHKVPATIQSRCQRFDFHDISPARITDHLAHVLSQEDIKADQGVLQRIARLADGSMRDALSILDRLLVAGDGSLEPDLLERMLGLPDSQLVDQLVASIAESDPAGALSAADQLLSGGLSGERVLDAVAAHLRTLLVSGICGPDAEILHLSQEQASRAGEVAAAFDAPGLVHMIAICDSVARSVRISSSPRAIFDATIVRLALAEHFTSSGTSASPATGRAMPAKKKLTDPRPAAKTAMKTPAVKKEAAPVAVPAISTETPWEQVLEVVDSAHDKAILEQLEFVSWDGSVLQLKLAESEGIDTSWVMKNPDRVPSMFSKILGRQIAVRIDQEQPKIMEPASSSDAVAEASTDPVVQDAIELFDAVLVESRPKKENQVQ